MANGVVLPQSAVSIDSIEDVEDVKLWIADHDSRINSYWREQFKFNSDVGPRVSSLEKKIIWLTAAAAAGGGAFGQLLTKLLPLAGG